MKLTTNINYILELNNDEFLLYMKIMTENIFNDDEYNVCLKMMTKNSYVLHNLPLIAIKMTEEEAIRLKQRIQNPSMDDEPSEIEEFRRKLWNKMIDVRIY